MHVLITWCRLLLCDLFPQQAEQSVDTLHTGPSVIYLWIDK